MSDRCSVTRREGRVIRGGDTNSTNDLFRNVTPSENSAGAFFLQSLHSLGNLSDVKAGTPLALSSKICLSCLQAPENQYVLSGCKISAAPEFPPGQIQVSVRGGDSSFGVVSAGFRTHIENLTGVGDLTFNGMHFEIFAFVVRNKSSSVLTYLSYNHQRHCEDLRTRAENAKVPGKKSPVIWEKTRARVRAFDIHCSTNQFSMEQFAKVLKVYRTIQLENTVWPTRFHTLGKGIDAEGFFNPMTINDVARAVLSIKIMDHTRKMGTFYEYKLCTTYEWQFILPLALSLVGVIVLGVYAIGRANAGIAAHVPYNSRSWFVTARDMQKELRGVTWDGDLVGAGSSLSEFLERSWAGSVGSTERESRRNEMMLVRNGESFIVEYYDGAREERDRKEWIERQEVGATEYSRGGGDRFMDDVGGGGGGADYKGPDEEGYGYQLFPGDYSAYGS